MKKACYSRHVEQLSPPTRYALVGLIVIATALRAWAARDEFWLDEIWSLMAFTRAPYTWTNVFTFHHDNNHYLITLWMNLIGSDCRNWVVYRLPSIAAGMGTVILAAATAARWGRAAMLAAALCTASSFVLVLYGSEARGYALCGFFSLIAFLALDRHLRTSGVGAAAVFVAATMLGVLSHLTFVQFYFGALVWSGVVLFKSSASWRQALGRWAFLHAVPLGFLVTLYFVDVRAMQIGGGDAYRMLDVIASALALAGGCYAEQPSLVMLAAAAVAVVAIAGIVALAREGSNLWIFFLAGFIAAPALLLTASRPTLLYERYFYLNLLYFLILASFLAGRLIDRGGLARWLAVAGILLLVGGNAALTADFLRIGRGHYLDALRYMAQHSPEGTIRLAGDDDFDNTLYLGFYSAYLPEGLRLFYCNFHKPAQPREPAPDWLLTHGQIRPFAPVAEVRPAIGGTYRLVQTYPCGRLSGYNFALYRRE